MNFKDMDLADNLITALNAQNIKQPTDIQQQLFAPVLDNRDVIGCSQTGSGKTLAYLIPLFCKIDVADTHVQAVIAVPTQELGIQVLRQIQLLAGNASMDIRAIALVGEGNISRQIDSIKTRPQIIVGTTGRILKLIHMKKLSVHNVKTLIVDEADKMLAKDNIDGLTQLRRSLMKYTQIIMVSASMDKKSIQSASAFNSEPVILNIKADKAIPGTIRHMFIISDRRNRIETLRSVINALSPKKGIIFANTAYDLEETVNKLVYHHYKADMLYGSNDKLQRKKAVEEFRSGKINFLVSTDLASRGLQIDGIDAVFNLNLPENSTEYQHRAGRCGRNGMQGVCVSVITPNEVDKIKAYQKEFGINIIQRRLFKGKLVAK